MENSERAGLGFFVFLFFLSSALERDNVYQNLIVSNKNVHHSNASSFIAQAV